jgi:hypothetical protein
VQDPALSWRQRFEPLDIAFDDYGFGALRNIPLDAGRYGVKQRLIAYGFSQEVDGSGLHCLHGHRNVAMTGQENDRLPVTVCSEMVLQVEAARSRHPNVEDQASGSAQCIRLQQFSR